MKRQVKYPLIVLAAGLVLVGASGVGATRAAMTYQTNAEAVDFTTAALSVDLQEMQDGKYVSVDGKDTLKFTDISSSDFHIGQKYNENVRIVNTSSGKYDEYVRISIKKSWANEDGTKNTTLDPEMIELPVADGWIEDTSEETAEGKVYYYKAPVAYGEENAIDFLKTIKINDKIMNYVTTVQKKGDDPSIKGTIINEYKYNGESFFVEVRVDAVQAHNAEEAMLGAWGIDTTVNESGVITSLNGLAID